MAWFLLVWYFFCSKCLRSQVAVIFHFEIVKFVQFLSCWCWHLLLNKTCVATCPFYSIYVRNDFFELCYIIIWFVSRRSVIPGWSKKKKKKKQFIYIYNIYMHSSQWQLPGSTVCDNVTIIFAHGHSCHDWSCVEGSRDRKISHYSPLQNSPAEIICSAGKTSTIN